MNSSVKKPAILTDCRPFECARRQNCQPKTSVFYASTPKGLPFPQGRLVSMRGAVRRGGYGVYSR
ncbi:MAG: hypothetical protein DBY17_06860 [Oscillospiraceae bacterium]|nr:MAG: hypothetical protein DBY17_06860 [Oscillospiraceae bacterium]